jgi:hypothetical protein
MGHRSIEAWSLLRVFRFPIRKAAHDRSRPYKNFDPMLGDDQYRAVALGRTRQGRYDPELSDKWDWIFSKF